MLLETDYLRVVTTYSYSKMHFTFIVGPDNTDHLLKNLFGSCLCSMLIFPPKVRSKMVTFLLFATHATVKVKLITGICISAIALAKQAEEIYNLQFLAHESRRLRVSL